MQVGAEWVVCICHVTRGLIFGGGGSGYDTTPAAMQVVVPQPTASRRNLTKEYQIGGLT